MAEQTDALIAIKIKEIYPRLMNYAVHLTRNKTLAEDLVQDTIKKVLENRETWNDIANFTAWSVTIMKNRFKDMIKKKKEFQFLPKVDDQEIDNDPGIKDESLDTDTKILLHECLKKLGKDKAELFLMNQIQGITTSVISSILKTSQNTILTWINQANNSMKDCINFG